MYRLDKEQLYFDKRIALMALSLKLLLAGL